MNSKSYMAKAETAIQTWRQKQKTGAQFDPDLLRKIVDAHIINALAQSGPRGFNRLRRLAQARNKLIKEELNHDDEKQEQGQTEGNQEEHQTQDESSGTDQVHEEDAKELPSETVVPSVEESGGSDVAGVPASGTAVEPDLDTLKQQFRPGPKVEDQDTPDVPKDNQAMIDEMIHNTTGGKEE